MHALRHGRGHVHRAVARDEHRIFQLHDAHDLATALRARQNQRGGGASAHDAAGKNYRRRHRALGRIASSRFDDMLIALALVIEITLVISGGVHALVAVDVNSGEYAGAARVADADMPRPVAVTAVGAQITACIDVGVGYAVLPLLVFRAIDGVALHVGTEGELHRAG